ncbi:MAG: DUF4411 family protein [Peptostreptococcaceae bacterium]|nr:DUF4411 family protein [Peptostreptococcaceae bacterium]
MMKYLLDSNIFIQAKNSQYPFDAFPGFWEWLKRDMEAGIVASIEPVYKEIIKGNDELGDWVKVCQECGCFLSVDDSKTQTKFAEVASWAVDPAQDFKPTAYQEFLQVADSWLIAKAHSTEATVVTLEKFDPQCKKRVLIPNACETFGVEYINTIELIRRIGVKFGIV